MPKGIKYMRYRDFMVLNEEVMTFYHGSKHPIKKFSMNYLSSGSGVDQEGPGIYLTSSREDAMIYGNYIHEVKVDINRSRMVPDKKRFDKTFVRDLIATSPEWDEIGYTDWDEYPDVALKKATDAVFDGYGPDQYREVLEQIWYDFYRNDSQQFLDKMVKIGYDGFTIHRQSGVTHLIVWNPNILSIVGMETV